MSIQKIEFFAYALVALLVIVGAVLGFAIFYEETRTAQQSEETPTEKPETEQGPKEYRSEKYNFTLTIPEGWTVREGRIGNVPAINFYPVSQDAPVQPYDHFANTTHVSVYPQGIPTEGLFAQTRPLDVSLSEEVEGQSRAYVLGNGDIFARYILFKDAPQEWNQSGFLWTRSYVQNQAEECLRGDEYIASETCDPFFGDEIVVTGEVAADNEQAIQNIVASFHFTGEKQVTDQRTHPLISVTDPLEREVISSPLELKGKARGQWFFEASAPVMLTDWDGRIIAESFITAEGNWMTTEYVPFSGDLSFDVPAYGERGFLIFQKSNASGLPEHDDAYEIEVRFR